MKEISFDETKNILLGIISDFDKFCRERGLRYSLAYGTLIGAVRHKGFIPWDDDIDVLMPRTDYNRFLDEYSHPYYKLESQDSNPRWPLNFAKLCDTRTVSTDDKGNTFSVAVDVFILDGLEDTLKKSEKMIAKVNRYHKVWSNQLFTKQLSFNSKYGFKKNLLIAGAKVAGLFIPFDPLVKRMLTYKQRRSVDSSQYCASLTGVCTIYETEKMLDYIDVPFEDMTLMICCNYDYQLRMTHGDYMTIPPEEERYNHGAKAFWK